MSRKYNLGNSSDMRRLSRDLQEAAKKQARFSVMSNGVPMECPNCGRKITVKPPVYKCPGCGKTIHLNVNF